MTLGATETLVINRAATARQGSNLAPRPADSSKAAGAAAGSGGDTETVALGGGAKPAPAASQQHTVGLTEALHNRTSHTMHSGSTVGSDDPTATMRMKTPAAAGLSARSGGSTGSIGEEATVCLRKPGSGGKEDGAGGGERGLRLPSSTLYMLQPGLRSLHTRAPCITSMPARR